MLRFFGFHAPKDFLIHWLSNIFALILPDAVYSRNALKLISLGKYLW